MNVGGLLQRQFSPHFVCGGSVATLLANRRISGVCSYANLFVLLICMWTQPADRQNMMLQQTLAWNGHTMVRHLFTLNRRLAPMASRKQQQNYFPFP